MMHTIVIATGGFDPIHSGHIEYLKAAKALGDFLIVGVNSDEWLERKKGQAFMPYTERETILRELGCVDAVLPFDDSDGSASALIAEVKQTYDYTSLVFANGGDRTDKNIPEMCEGVDFQFGVGGADKKNSSSWVLEKWNKQRKDTRWGYWEVLDDEYHNAKVKKLVVKPGGCLTYQRHQARAEEWFVVSGKGKVIFNNHSQDIYHSTDVVEPLVAGRQLSIPKMVWHQLINDNRDEDLIVYEIQHGTRCVEEDIESE